MNRSFSLLFAAVLAALPIAASAQTKAQRELSYFDLGIQGTGLLSKTVSGPVVSGEVFDTGQIVQVRGSNTGGGLATLRFTPKAYFGVEINASYARFTEAFSSGAFYPSSNVPEPLQIQTEANEFTAGYIVTPGYTIFGLSPYASAGAGTIRFAPTRGGGQGAPQEGRFAVYYNLGVQKALLSNFGVRLGFRQVFYQAPDFVQNYLTINKRTITSEPMIGFYLQF